MATQAGAAAHIPRAMGHLIAVALHAAIAVEAAVSVIVVVSGAERVVPQVVASSNPER